MTRHEQPPAHLECSESDHLDTRTGMSGECAALIQEIRSIKIDTHRYMRALFEEYLGPLKANALRDTPDS